MDKYKYDYNIYPDNSTKKFKEACRTIETEYPNIEKKKLLVDVDGSTIQVYGENENQIAVYDDYDVGAVYALSNLPLKNQMFELINNKIKRDFT